MIDDGGYRYRWVDVDIEPNERIATLTVTGPRSDEVPGDLEQIVEDGAGWWPLAMARELDDALLMLRANDREIGTLVLKTRGAVDAVLAIDRTMIANQDPLVRARDDRVPAPHPAAARCLLAQPLCDHRRGLVLCRQPVGAEPRRRSQLHAGGGTADRADRAQFRRSRNGERPHAAGDPLQRRTRAAALEQLAAEPLDAEAALEHGLVTFAPDELDWEDEIRLAIEERASLSPDALTGLEANLRFAGPETIATKYSAGFRLGRTGSLRVPTRPASRAR